MIILKDLDMTSLLISKKDKKSYKEKYYLCHIFWVFYTISKRINRFFYTKLNYFDACRCPFVSVVLELNILKPASVNLFFRDSYPS